MQTEKIKLTQIQLADEHPMATSELPKAAVKYKMIRAGYYAESPVVSKADGDSYTLHFGVAEYTRAQNEQQSELECRVVSEPSARALSEMYLIEEYITGATDPLRLGQGFRQFREQYNLSQLDLSRRLGISPGTVHHYESLAYDLAPALVKYVQTQQLTFKEARTIVDIKEHARQREVAEPFIERQLSSVHVEHVVRAIHGLTDVPIARVTAAAIEMVRARERVTAAELIKRARPSAKDNIEPLENRLLQLAGELATLASTRVPDKKVLKYISGLRILDSRLKLALESLNQTTAPLYSEQAAEERSAVAPAKASVNG